MKPSTAELKIGELSSANVDLAAQTIDEQGFVTLEGVFAGSWIESMKAAVRTELDARYRDREHELAQARFHGGMDSPMRAPFTDPQIIENRMIFQVLEKVLGPRFYGHLPYGCNTAFPGSGTQNVHRDCGHVFPELDSHLPPLLLVVNIALDDFTADNGATEIWPGSHQYVDADDEESTTLRIPEHRYGEHQSTRTLMSAGSVIIRDMRTWHRGMPNTTDEPRTMLMLVYYRQYFMPDSFGLDLEATELDQFSDKAKLVYRLKLRTG